LRTEMQTFLGSFRMSMLNFFSDPQWIIPNIIAPFIFTSVALIFFRNSSGPLALYAVLGGGMMGMWGNTLYGAGFALAFDRWNGTLEYVLGTPSRLIWIVAGRSASSAVLGLTNALAVILVAVAGFHAQLGVQNPVGFFFALILTLASLSALGVLFCSSFLLTRSAQVMTNGLEMPIYVSTGSMFPIALLPFWSHPFSLSLGPTWGIDALRYAADATYVGMGFGYWLDISVLVISTIAYLAIGFWLFIVVENKARRDASLVEY
jgi:ABC-2 type transport system permease protein